MMKKVLCIISILLCIFLTSCGNAVSIGIIGGADGPTSIIVSQKGEKEMYQQIAAEDALSKLGYTNVKEFGGIIDWTGALEN